MSISISNQVRVAIMHALEDHAQWVNETQPVVVNSTSDMDLYDIERVIYDVLSDFDWVDRDDLEDAAVSLAEDFDGVSLYYEGIDINV